MHPSRYDAEQLLFRRQFVLGPRLLDDFPRWRRIVLGSSIHLTVHPDLPLCHVANESSSLVLLGFLLDPYRPEDPDRVILQRLLRCLEDGGGREGLIAMTYPLGGRWILIVKNGRSAWLFNDPSGHRQVFYAPRTSGGVWCSSQPGILAHTLHLAPDPDAQTFIDTMRKRNPEYWWPGDTTLYKEVRHLQPNRVLDLTTGARRRFWPTTELTPRPLEDMVRENALLLRGVLASASRRYELALGITAGKDTRALLAACKDIRDQLYFFTLMYWNLVPSSPDLRVPSRLLSRLGLPHRIIVCPSRANREFLQLYRRNMTTAHECYAPIYQALLEDYPPQKVCLMGTGIDVTKSWYRRRLRRYWPDLDPRDVDVQTLARIIDQEVPFAMEAIRRWLSETEAWGDYRIDLFQWEERTGNWEAMSQAEQDIAQEAFSPFNCRQFITNALSTPFEHRIAPKFEFQDLLTRLLWPEVLSEPANPPDSPTLLSASIDALAKLREKVEGKRRQSPNVPALRAFMRHPILTDLIRHSQWRPDHLPQRSVWKHTGTPSTTTPLVRRKEGR